MKAETQWKLEDDGEFASGQTLPESTFVSISEKKKRISSEKWLGWVFILIPILSLFGFLIVIGREEIALAIGMAILVVVVFVLFLFMIVTGINLLKGDE